MSLHLRFRQRNNRLLFYVRGVLHLLLPCRGYTQKLAARYRAASPEEQAYVAGRSGYYLKLTAPFAVGDDGVSIREFRTAWKHRQRSAYFFDLLEHLRHFPDHFRFVYRFGDNSSVPPAPSFLKARTLSGDNANAVLLKLNRVRHFNFVSDRVSFDDKLDRLVWRGNASRPHRQQMVRQFHQHPLCDIGQTNTSPDGARWIKPYLTIGQQLRYKFILSVEGNDVATNLKWIMSSNSVCFMTRPTRETWFMEGTLIPDHHYVLLQDDYSNLEERIRFHTAHPAIGREIVRNAQAHVAQFRDEARETIIALHVLNRYFHLSGQSRTPGV